MAEAVAEKGKASFLRGDFPAAITAWTQAIDLLSTSQSTTIPPAPDGGLKARCLANRAQAWLQLRDYAAAERDCGASLRLDPSNAKVLLRRATALLALERVPEAQATLDRALALRPPLSLLRALQGLREQARAMAAMLQGPGGVDADAKEAIGLVDPAQTLRLSFRDGPPPTLPWGAWCTISLFLSNEFGLWRRADFPARDADREALPLEFMVYDHGGGYCSPSAVAGVEVMALASESEKGGGDEDGDGSQGAVVALRRHTSCRVRCRLRFRPLSDSVAAHDTAVVHVRIGLPPSLLSREVLPVISLPIRLVSDGNPSDDEEGEDIDARLGIKGCRTIYLPALGRALLCAESPGQAGIAGKVWDAGLVLTHYLASRPEVISPPKTCIELGAGTGAAGIAAALLGARSVVVTDLESVVALIQRNIDLNIPPASSSSSSSPSPATAAGYAWGESKAALDGDDATFDSILMADVVYDPKYYSALVKALRDLSHAGTVVTLAHRERHPDAALFFEEARRHFSVQKVPFSLEEEEEEKEGGGTAQRACADVHIFEMRLLCAPEQQQG